MSANLSAPRPGRLTRTLLADHELRGDGAPIWLLSRGRPHERCSERYTEADLRRQKLVKSLARYATRDSSALADKLCGCSSDEPCASGACPVCARVMQRHFVREGERVLSAFPRQDVLIASIVPVCGRLGFAKDAVSAWQSARRDFKRKLASTGATVVLAGADFSINESQQSIRSSYVQGHFYAFIIGADRDVTKRTRDAFPATTDVPRPVQFRAWDGDVAAIAYAMKNSYSLRTEIIAGKANRASHRNTHTRPLFGRRLVRLSMLLDAIGLDSRRILLGVKRSRKAGVVRYRMAKSGSS